jgi:hypothetical protein
MEFYSTFFLPRVQALIVSLCDANEEEEFLLSRRRKFSLPDAEIRKKQFEDESAFGENPVMYEPLQKTVFINDNNSKSKLSGTSHLILSKSNLMAYSTSCSPLLSRSVNSSSMSRTPRTKRVKEVYTDYISDTLIFSASHQSSSGHNKYKHKVRTHLIPLAN